MAKSKIKKLTTLFKKIIRSKKFLLFKKQFLRWVTPLGVILIFSLIILSIFLPKTKLQSLKDNLLRNPENMEVKLKNIEALLKENQFQASEEILKSISPYQNGSLNQLWQEKHYSDPEDIKELIKSWEKIIEDKPQYRDAYLQLTILNYKIKETQKAENNLNKALEIDPNFELTKRLKEIIFP